MNFYENPKNKDEVEQNVETLLGELENMLVHKYSLSERNAKFIINKVQSLVYKYHAALMDFTLDDISEQVSSQIEGIIGDKDIHDDRSRGLNL